MNRRWAVEFDREGDLSPKTGHLGIHVRILDPTVETDLTDNGRGMCREMTT